MEGMLNKLDERNGEGGSVTSLRSPTGEFQTAFVHIVSSLTQETPSILEGLKMTVLSQSDLLYPASEESIASATSIGELFRILNAQHNWVDVSILEAMVKASYNDAAKDVLEVYKKSLEEFIPEAVARLVDPSINGTCPQPDANSCILQLIFSDRREDMRVKEVLACKDFLYVQFGIQPECIQYIGVAMGNNLVTTWLASRHIGWRIVNQCRSAPVLGALSAMEVVLVRMRYPGLQAWVHVETSAQHSGQQMALKSFASPSLHESSTVPTCRDPSPGLVLGPKKQVKPQLKLPFPHRERKEELFEEWKLRKTGTLNFGEDEPALPFSGKDMDTLVEIGQGVRGRVFRMTHKPSGRVIAAKQMDWRCVNKGFIKNLDVMTLQHCPYTVRYYGLTIEHLNLGEVRISSSSYHALLSTNLANLLSAYHSRNTALLCMELMDSCMAKILRKTGPIPEPIIGTILVSVVQGLDYLEREHHLLHRNVKLSNLLVSRCGQVKLCDFGISFKLMEDMVFSWEDSMAFYMAPELITNLSSGHTVKPDVWSLGMSVVRMLEGKIPLPERKTEFELLWRIVNGDPPLPDKTKCSEQFYDFLLKCLTKDEALRPDYPALLKHQFLLTYQSQPEDMTSWVQSKLAVMT